MLFRHKRYKKILLTTSIFICTILRIVVFHYIKFSIYLSAFEEQDEMASRFDFTFKTYNNIPLVVHQIWTTNRKIPKNWEPAQRSWFQEIAVFNKSFKPVYMLWNHKQLDNFIRETFPWFYKTYSGYKYFIQRIDAARYFILYYYGGIYSDLDVGFKKTIKSLVNSLRPGEGVALIKTEPTGVATDFIMASRKHPFMKYVVNGLKMADTGYILPYLTAMLATGPVYLSKKYNLYLNKSEIHIINQEHAHDLFQHFEGGTWHEFDGKIIWWCFTKRHILLNYLKILAVLFVAIIVFKRVMTMTKYK